MTLREHQEKFYEHSIALGIFALDYCKKNGYTIVAKERLRSPLQSWSNALPSYSTIHALTKAGVEIDYHDTVGGVGIQNSLHLKCLADDLILFKDGVDVTSKETMQPLGDYWESLDPLNRWGGKFSTRSDPYHFERNA